MAFVFQKDADGYQNPAQSSVPVRVAEPRPPTFAEILAAVDIPLDRFESSTPAPPNAKERHRLLLAKQRAKLARGGEWDETTLAGREALMLALGFTP